MLLIMVGLLPLSLFAQKDLDTLLVMVKEAYELQAYDAMIKLADTGTENFRSGSQVDSLKIAELIYQKANAFYYKEDYNSAISQYDTAVSFCPGSDVGRNKKAIYLFERAFAEYDLSMYETSYNTVKKSETIFRSVENPDYDFLLSVYGDLCSSSLGYGFYGDAEYYLIKGEKLFRELKDTLPQLQGDLGKIKRALFLYKGIELYTSIDSIDRFEGRLREFDLLAEKGEVVDRALSMYAASLNLVGDYYINKYKDGKYEGTKELERGIALIEKAIKVCEGTKYKGYISQFTFNIAKAESALGNQKSAHKRLDEVFEMTESPDSRLPFFYALRSIIFMEEGKKKKSLEYLNKTIQSIHKGSSSLNDDYSNFVPGTELNEVYLLLDFAELFPRKFQGDKQVEKLSNALYPLALSQYKNAYKGAVYSKDLRLLSRRIFQGLLNNEIRGSGSIPKGVPGLLEEIENIENRLAWKEFQSRRAFSTCSGLYVVTREKAKTKFGVKRRLK